MGSFILGEGRGFSKKGKRYIWGFEEALVGWNRASFGQALHHVFLMTVFCLFDQAITFAFEDFAIVEVGRRPFRQGIPPSYSQLLDQAFFGLVYFLLSYFSLISDYFLG